MYGTALNVFAIEEDCVIYGPGIRTVIWFQGCSIRCPGCWNKDMWSTEPSILMERTNLLDIILKSGHGVTFLGGEPLDQHENLLWLLQRLREKNIETMLYTGHEQQEIDSNPVFREICDIPKILVTGRYHAEERDTNLTWRGSRNQHIIIKGAIEVPLDSNHVEIRINEDGSVTYMGYPDEFMN